jgi:hypothetical protein
LAFRVILCVSWFEAAKNMATLTPNTLIGVIHGKIGNLVFVRRKNGKVFVRHRPVRRAPPSEAELVTRARLIEGNRYVQRTKQQADAYAPYQAAAKASGKRACDLARADFSHPPAIHDVDLSSYTGKLGDTIRIEAVDDFGVDSVLLTITQLDGALIEHGAAVPEENGSKWVYTAQAAVSQGQTVVIHVRAWDRTGNVVTKTLHRAI